MQMSLEFSDAELRRLRDHDALVTHVGITTLSDVECQTCQTSMHDMLLKFATLSAQEIPKLKSLASFKMLTFKDLKAAKMALATKEDAEPVLRLAKLMGLIGGNFSGSTLDVFILASQQAGARDFAQVQAVSLPEASPPPPASELAMTASAPADNLVTDVETPQLPRRHRRDIPMCAFIEPVRCAKTQPQDEGSPKPCGRLHKAQEVRHKAAPRGSHLLGHKGCARPGDGHAEE
jgi:hypothetical protein